MRYFSFKGNERYSEFIKSKGQLGFQPDSILTLAFSFSEEGSASRLFVTPPRRTLWIALYSARFSFRERARAEFGATYERVATCNTSPNRLSYDALRYPLRLPVPAILDTRITYRLVARAFLRKGSSLALPLTKCRGFCARSYNLHRALGGFLGEQAFWSFHERNIENFSYSSKPRVARVVRREEWYN